MIYPAPEALLAAVKALNALGRPYIVTGSVASNAYGEPRGTIDADFVVDVREGDVDRLRAMLHDEFVPEAQMAFETVTGKVQHKFRHRASKFLIEVFEARMDDPHEKSRFERRHKASILGEIAWFPTAEDVIVGKLRWYKPLRRSKDREDIVKVILAEYEHLDWSYIERWCAELGTRELLRELSRDVDEARKRL